MNAERYEPPSFLIAPYEEIIFSIERLKLTMVKKNKKPNGDIEFEIRKDFISELTQLQEVRDFVHACCERERRLSINFIHLMQLAVDEAFCNIVEHGYMGKVGNSIVIATLFLPNGIFFQLSDKGISLDPNNIPEYALKPEEGGIGWHLIKEIADYIVYAQKEAEHDWNHLRIFKSYH